MTKQSQIVLILPCIVSFRSLRFLLLRISLIAVLWVVELPFLGIFAAGDVTDVPFEQAVISAGQGAIAALSAYNYIQKLEGKPAIRTDRKSIKK